MLYSLFSDNIINKRVMSSDGDTDAYCVCSHDLWAGTHAGFSVMCAVYTSKNDNKYKFCNVVRTWNILETISHDSIKWVVLCFITCTSFKHLQLACYLINLSI